MSGGLMMDCPTADELAKAVAGRLPTNTADLLFEHVTRCVRCQQHLPESTADDLERVVRRASDRRSDLDSVFVRTVIGRIQSLSGSDSIGDSRLREGSAPSSHTDVASGPSWPFLSPPESADELGRLGEYRIVRLIAIGGMGIVFEAEDQLLKRRVALKFLKPNYAPDPVARQRYLREAQAIAALQHDHIITIFQVGMAGEFPFMAMPLLAGETLQTRLSRESILPVPVSLQIAREVAAALAAAHERGIIHRDVKPGNIWLEAGTSRVRLLDFGLARPLLDEVELTQQGVLLGTPSYMSPEQVGSEPIDARADLFSLGVVLYRITTGQLPFPGDRVMEILKSLATVDPVDPQQRNPQVDPELSKLIRQMLEKDRQNRPATANEVERRLQALQTRVTEGAASDSRSVPGITRSATPLGLATLFGAMIVVAVLIGTGWIPWTPSGQNEPPAQPLDDSPKAAADNPTERAIESVPRNEEYIPESFVFIADTGGELPPWKLPEGAPSPLREPFTAEEAKTARQAWAKLLNAPEEKTVNGVRLLLIPPGDFQIGVSEENLEAYRQAPTTNWWLQNLSYHSTTPRRARLTQAMYIGATEVTTAQFEKFVRFTGHITTAEEPGNPGGMCLFPDRMPRGREFTWRTPHDRTPDPNEPVTQLSIRDMEAFCDWMGGVDGYSYRLPTETEWEYAARSGETPRGLLSDSRWKGTDYAWLGRYPRGDLPTTFTLPVGLKQPNAFGLFDCIGNVCEACYDDHIGRSGWKFKYHSRGFAYNDPYELVSHSSRSPVGRDEPRNNITGFRVFGETTPPGAPRLTRIRR